jgi:decaprenylphospho-beta-D-erythro-pentofuranosid-2-ulose 2-reductase
MKAVLLGATQGMGRALARLLAARGAPLFLLGNLVEDLEFSARDLEIYGAPVPVKTAYCDLLQPATFAPALDQAQRALDGFDTVVVTAGVFATQEELENDAQLTARLLAADFANTVLFCEEARKRLLSGGGGTLCVFSSVAGERGRKPVRRRQDSRDTWKVWTTSSAHAACERCA